MSCFSSPGCCPRISQIVSTYFGVAFFEEADADGESLEGVLSCLSEFGVAVDCGGATLLRDFAGPSWSGWPVILDQSEIRSSLKQQGKSPGRFAPGPGAIYLGFCESDRNSAFSSRFTRNHAPGMIWDVPRLI